MNTPVLPFRTSIGFTLNSFLLLLAVLPVVLVVFIASNLFQDQAQDQAVNQMVSLADTRTREIGRWLNNSQVTLNLVLANPEQQRRMGNILITAGNPGPTGSNVRQYLSDQLLLQNAFEELYLYNTDGEIRISTDPRQEGRQIEAQPYFEPSLAGATVYPPYYDTESGRMTAIVMLPITHSSGDVIGFMAGRLSMSTLSSIMGTTAGLGETGETYLISRENSNFVTPGRFEPHDPTIPHNSEGIEKALAEQSGQSFYENYRGKGVIGVYRWIPELQAGMLAEIEEQEALEAVFAVRNLSLIAALVTAVIAMVLGAGVSTWITRPIRRLTEVATSVMKGDYTPRADIQRSNEIGQLADAFNTMTDELVKTLGERNRRIQEVEELSQTLEQRVTERTRDLQVAADVARNITTVLNLDELLQKVVALTATNFKLDSVTVFLPDSEGKTLNPAAAADASGQPFKLGTLSEGIPLDAEPSLIALAGRSQELILSNDVSQSPQYRTVSVLANTRSELTIPMLLEHRLLGIFDLQSNQVNRFSEDDLRVLKALAEQIAIAVRNAQLFTEAEIAKAKAEQANQVKSQFLASVSHELRTPLNAILNFSKFVATGRMGEVNESQVEALNYVSSSGEHLLNLINDVLDISKIEAGGLELFIEDDIHLKEEMEIVIATAESALKDKSVDFVVEIDENLPTMRGDRQRITQIMLNLVSNACKFTDKGKITLSIQQQDGEILMAVKDTGAGIAPEDQSIIFEVFRQAKRGIQQGKGTGLGLPISRRLAEAHGGRLWVESAVGEGTTFYVALPLQAPVNA